MNVKDLVLMDFSKVKIITPKNVYNVLLVVLLVPDLLLSVVLVKVVTT